MQKVDIIIPLGNGSKSNNDELKILLRSLEKNGRNFRNIIVVTAEPPPWLCNVKVISMARILMSCVETIFVLVLTNKLIPLAPRLTNI